MLGSIDSNTGSPDLGWDTDQFPMDIKNTTMVMKVGPPSPNSLYFIYTPAHVQDFVRRSYDYHKSLRLFHFLLSIYTRLQTFFHFKKIYFSIFSQTVLEQGGLSPGGLNFDCKVRRESTELRDMFISHIGTYSKDILKIC